MPVASRDGSSPEVEVAMIASGGAASAAWASSEIFSASRSGALSWTR